MSYEKIAWISMFIVILLIGFCVWIDFNAMSRYTPEQIAKNEKESCLGFSNRRAADVPIGCLKYYK